MGRANQYLKFDRVQPVMLLPVFNQEAFVSFNENISPRKLCRFTLKKPLLYLSMSDFQVERSGAIGPNI